MLRGREVGGIAVTDYAIGDGSERPARYYTRSDGYCRWRAWDPMAGKERYVGVHQLTAIATGAEPREVFSGGEFETHHESGYKYDNRPENLTVLRNEDHAYETFGHGRAEV